MEHNILLQLAQLLMRVHIVNLSERLLLGQLIAGCPITANSPTYDSSAAALSLSLVYSMHHAFANTIQTTARLAYSFKLSREAVLDVLILASSALEDQPHIDIISFPLFEMNYRSAGTEIVSTVQPCQRVN